MLNQDEYGEIRSYIEDKININNAAALYRTSVLFNFSYLSKLSLEYMERCFPILADSPNFLQLDFTSLRKLLASDQLHIDTELQVFNAANDWLMSHEIIQRRKHAQVLLSTIRLPLLSVPALNYILETESRFSMMRECRSVIKEVLKNNMEPRSNNVIATNRYCNQNRFNTVICGGAIYSTNAVISDVRNIEAFNVNNVTTLPQMQTGRCRSKLVCIKDEVYVFGGYDVDGNYITSVEKYSATSNVWTKVTEMHDDCNIYCAWIAFMDSIFVIGRSTEPDSCAEFNTKDQTWRGIAGTNEPRKNSAAACFNGKIVASGGLDDGASNTVEAYDHVADTWSYMPKMVERRCCHKLTAVKNKLFVVPGFFTMTCEVFDLTCNKFVLLRPSSSHSGHFSSRGQVVSVGSKLVVFGVRTSKVLFYDFENDEWSEDSCEITKDLTGFCCGKLPQF